MRRLSMLILALAGSLCPAQLIPAEDARSRTDKSGVPIAQTVEQLTESARKSVVVITVPGRDGKSQGLGSGFILSADGLIATNLHVIGEARPIIVELADGKRHEVKTVHASDRKLDLAVVRIEASDLPALELGDSDTLKDGQAIVALGNPRGLARSVVAGVVSGRRQIEDRPMIQLAIPLERGNSGGPLLDMQGRVQGVLTLKSAVTENLGFAMPVNALKPLIKKPNPVPMSAWLTIGTLDPKEWTPLFGARWKRRAGRIQVEGTGAGFGGRSLCLSQSAVPEPPYEVAVTVRLDDESGAAGLAFAADGGDRHYGFYPTNGRLRLTRFDGPDVFSWKVLREEPSPEYRPGEWNTLKVRVEKDKLLCYVNEQLVIESADDQMREGKVGVAKFRDTQAEFKGFQIAKQLTVTKPSAETVQRITKAVVDLPGKEVPKPGVIDGLLPHGPATQEVLRERARQLEQQAAQLRRLATAVHEKRVRNELLKTLEGKDDAIDLVRAALVIARLDNEELEIDGYCMEVERLARELAAGLPKDADDKAKLAALNKFLFTERGFHGGRSDYYNRSNSYLNEVLDDREGLPITLSIIYMEIARRIGLNVVGIGLPAHFVVKHVPAKGEGQLIDAFEAGQLLTRADAELKVKELTDGPLREEHLVPMTRRAIIVRVLHNLLGIARRERDAEGVLRYVEAIVAVSPDAVEERWLRALGRYQQGDRQGAREDADWLLEHQPNGIDLDRVRDFRRHLDRPER